MSKIPFLFFVSLFLSTVSYAAGFNRTTISIMGEVVGVTCSIKDDNLSVDLGQTTNKDLFFHKRARNSQNFNIEFICDPGQQYTVDITFTGIESSELDLQGTVKVNGKANLGVQLAEGHDEASLFSINHDNNIVNNVIEDGSSLPFSAFLRLSTAVSDVSQVPLGYYEATANFLVEYE